MNKPALSLADIAEHIRLLDKLLEVCEPHEVETIVAMRDRYLAQREDTLEVVE